MLGFEFRMKTGFFATKLYDLLIRKEELIFSPKESGDRLVIPEKSILGITLKKSVKSFEMEIQTYEKNYQGLLDNQANYEQLLMQLKENINKKILYEYEGGN